MSSEMDGIAPGAQPPAEADLVALRIFPRQPVEADARVLGFVEPSQGDDLPIERTLKRRHEEPATPDRGLSIHETAMTIIAGANRAGRLPHVNGERDQPVPLSDVGIVPTETAHPPG